MRERRGAQAMWTWAPTTIVCMFLIVFLLPCFLKMSLKAFLHLGAELHMSQLKSHPPMPDIEKGTAIEDKMFSRSDYQKSVKSNNTVEKKENNRKSYFPIYKSAQRLGRLSLKGCCVICVWLRPLTKNTFALTLVDSQAIETLRSATVAMKQPNRKRKLSLDSKEHWNQDGCLEQAEEDKTRDGATSLSHGSRQVVPNPGNR
ncbi:Lethal(3)malignant brain tumor-like protein 4 [Manis javanica]|nr:Lethal(3)malignant brain tumor-like protein 4 [Manis javanica]